MKWLFAVLVLVLFSFVSLLYGGPVPNVPRGSGCPCHANGAQCFCDHPNSTCPSNCPPVRAATMGWGKDQWRDGVVFTSSKTATVSDGYETVLEPQMVKVCHGNFCTMEQRMVPVRRLKQTTVVLPPNPLPMGTGGTVVIPPPVTAVSSFASTYSGPPPSNSPVPLFSRVQVAFNSPQEHPVAFAMRHPFKAFKALLHR